MIRRVRAFLAATPIIVVSAQGDEETKVTALDLGADDYVEKPFALPELLARVRVGLRHAERAAPAPSRRRPCSSAARCGSTSPSTA